MTKRISANVTEEDFTILQELADEQGISMTDVLRRALRTSKWLRTIRGSDRKLIIRDEKAKSEQEVVMVD
jgi:hypothetical protein